MLLVPALGKSEMTSITVLKLKVCPVSVLGKSSPPSRLLLPQGLRVKYRSTATRQFITFNRPNLWDLPHGYLDSILVAKARSRLPQHHLGIAVGSSSPQ